MTKMPDKTHPDKLYRTFLTDAEGKTRPLLFTKDELQHFDPETEFAEYTRSDLIPQPVTDVSFDPKPSEDYEILKRQFSAAKNLINAQAAEISHYSKRDYSLSSERLDELTSALESEKDMNAQLTEELESMQKPVTDEARAKALDALDEVSECINSILTLAERNGVTELAKWKFKDQCETIRAALSKPIDNDTNVVIRPPEAMRAKNQKLHDKVAYTEGKLSVYVEEYPKVVAERDALRRAVVDLGSISCLKSANAALEKHAATIAKAKAVQS